MNTTSSTHDDHGDDHTLISVIIPCYNAEAYLADAIDSVRRQEIAALEIIVIDDGSIDGSAEIARRFAPSVRYEWQAHAGIAAARNRGVALSRGRYLAFLDADDVWPDGSLRHRLEVLRAHPDTAGVFGAVQEFVSPELAAAPPARLAHPRPAQPARLAGSMLIERDAFLHVGVFDPRLTVGETLDWMARADDAGLVMRTIETVVLRRRLHGDNTVTREKARRSDYLQALRATLARRRAARAASAAASDSHPGPDRS